jgi:hypothetical protein
MPVLNLSAVARAPLRRDPFDCLVVEDAIAPEALAQLNRDYPLIDKPTNHDPRDLQYGESFGRLPEELTSAEFERQVANKFVEVFPPNVQRSVDDIERPVPEVYAVLVSQLTAGADVHAIEPFDGRRGNVLDKAWRQ